LLPALSAIPVFAQNTITDGSRSLHAYAGKIVGKIHSFQGLNGQPTPVMPGLPDLIQRYHELRVNQVRAGKMLDTPQRLPVVGTDTYGFSAIAGRSSTAIPHRSS
jgi:hypothetical protein